jgi:hypothetical protein
MMQAMPRIYRKVSTRALAALLAVFVNRQALADESVTPNANGTENKSLGKIYRQAKAAYDAAQFAECKRILREGGVLTPVMLVLMAQAECELKEFKSCATHSAQALQSPEHEPDKRKAIEEMRAEAAREVGSLRLIVSTEGAEVAIDRHVWGTTPIEHPIYLDPGTHELTLKKVGYTTLTREVDAQRGVETSLIFSLTESTRTVGPTLVPTVLAPVAPPSREASQASRPFQVSTRDDSNAPNATILVLGGVLTVGGLATGLYLTTRADAEFNQAQELRNSLPPSACAASGPSTQASCASLRDHLQAGDRQRNLATLGFVVGGAALVGTAVFWAWPRGKLPTTPRGLRLNASMARGDAWLEIAQIF